MEFYTKDEFDLFINKLMDKRLSYISFMIFYWTGIRLGELLALTLEDIDFDEKTLSINKSYQRLDREDVVTIPKTDKSNRVIHMPDFLVDDLKDYVDHVFALQPTQRLLPVSKYYLEREVKRGAKEAGLKQIRVHDMRHSHVALLIEMGMPILAISERLGHEKVETTLNTYGHLYPNKQRQLADMLNDKYQEEL